MEPPEEFHHPFHPYPIQNDFMKGLYSTLESKSVGIFESPTGTGKSLSLICGALTWLRDHKRWVLEHGDEEETTGGTEPAWVLEYERQERRAATEVRKREMEERIVRLREKERREKLAAKKAGARPVKRRKEMAIEDESEFLLDEYHSDDESENVAARKDTVGGSNISPEVLKMLQQMAPAAPVEKEEDEPDEIKIFYASRTHSQLSQFVGELGRPQFPATYPSPPPSTNPSELVKHIPLASRKQLCINPSVSRLSSQTAVNEKCLELQKKTSKHRCEFKLNPNDPLDTIKQRDFRDHALAEIRDIEDLADLGKTMGVCPYYASRQAMKPTEIVTLPYPLLLQQSTRESLGIDLTGHIVIIDEAHNIIDAISALHSATITQSQILLAKQQLEIYLGKFTTRLSGRNKQFIKQILSLLRRLDEVLTEKKGSAGQISAAEVLGGGGTGGLDQVNFYRVEKYLRTSGLARKVDGYSTHLKSVENSATTTANTPVLMTLQSFLGALNNPRREGRIFYSKQSDAMQFRYLLLDVSVIFSDIVKSARAVVLAGGTMSPLDSYINTLLPDIPKDKLRIHSFPHIIPAENLCVSTLSRGPSGRELVFDFSRRDDKSMMEELGRAIIGLAGLVKQGGIVIFVPSYGYLDNLFSAWQTTILPKLQAKRKVFREPQNSSSIDDAIRDYATAIQQDSTALLFSVISGKLSEGINFSDSLCRLILLVGIPYPNPFTPEQKSRQTYLQDTLVQRGVSPDEARKKAAEAGEDTALRTVNQAIGRAVRHKGDWACIVLVDERWEGGRVRGKLAGWIREGVGGGSAFGEVVGKVGGFFRVRRGI